MVLQRREMLRKMEEQHLAFMRGLQQEIAKEVCLCCVAL